MELIFAIFINTKIATLNLYASVHLLLIIKIKLLNMEEEPQNNQTATDESINQAVLDTKSLPSAQKAASQ
jgi:hypothetical protein